MLDKLLDSFSRSAVINEPDPSFADNQKRKSYDNKRFKNRDRNSKSFRSLKARSNRRKACSLK